MRTPRSLRLPLVGGPLDGRQRRVRRAPHELPTSIALPSRGGLRRNISAGDELAVYQLRNDNGQWSYYHQQTATASQLGVEESLPNENMWGEDCPPFAR